MSDVGKLEIILGCMFSGKSTELIKRIRLHKLLERRVYSITHSSDMRYGNNIIVSHDKEYELACSVTTLSEIQKSELEMYDVVCIEEAHFFPDLVHFVKDCVENLKKHVIVCGLDGNFKREPFRNILDLVPFADEVKKTKALCLLCKDGTSAVFSKRLIDVDDEFLVGGRELYSSVCRFHYNAK